MRNVCVISMVLAKSFNLIHMSKRSTEFFQSVWIFPTTFVQIFEKVVWEHWYIVLFCRNFWGANVQVAAMWPRFNPFRLYSIKLSQGYIYLHRCSWSIVKLKKKIENAFREIDITMCWMVFVNLLKRAPLCLANEGGHFKHLLGLKFCFFFFVFLFKCTR